MTACFAHGFVEFGKGSAVQSFLTHMGQLGLEDLLPEWHLHLRARRLCAPWPVRHVASGTPGPLHVAWASCSGGLWVGRCSSHVLSGFLKQEAGATR